MFNLAKLFFLPLPYRLGCVFYFESFGRDGRTEASKSVVGNYTLSTPEMAGGLARVPPPCFAIDSLRGSGEGNGKQTGRKFLFHESFNSVEKTKWKRSQKGDLGWRPCTLSGRMVTLLLFLVAAVLSFFLLF